MSESTTDPLSYDQIKASLMRGAEVGALARRILILIPFFGLMLLRATLTALASWSLPLLRHRVGLHAALAYLLLGVPSFMLALGTALSVPAAVVMFTWWLLLALAAARHVAVGVYRLFRPRPMSEHVTRWSGGEPAVFTGWLWARLARGWDEEGRVVAALGEPLVMAVLSIVLLVLDRLVFVPMAGGFPSFIFLVPLVSAFAMLAGSALLAVREAWVAMLMADSFVEQQEQSAKVQKLTTHAADRPVEGEAQLPLFPV